MKKSALRKNLPLIITGLVALGVVAAAAYVHFNRPSSQNLADTVPSSHPGAGAAGTTQPSSSSGSNSSNGSSPAPSPTPATDPQYNSSTLAKPTGQLLSNHTISLGATDPSMAPSESSTCVTVPGATCTIRLTGPDGTIKYVADQPVTVNDQGGANFDWNAKTRGLTAGKWKVEAVAEKDGQTATSNADYLTVNL